MPKGALRVVGETEPVPFIEAFVNEQLSESDRGQLSAALLKVTEDPAMRMALETLSGFVAMPEQPAATPAATAKKN